ncbi:probable cytochrome P450 6a14 [Neodiprion pinetum]|uniref:probable cytochrome P450 6a14 n=1 Tax=Neodiprion pinetum TaxID=441929 RepID=UPI001EDD9C3B|nr:probable cytochrome P450 6a14 [Neodiprion pinetum]XP_046466985.1 probable cytochrome P450 6a14 [Neodiprion pinetum]XP_046466986.1 probable cytochrome P450 6a14 [Neodiprion pinetum]
MGLANFVLEFAAAVIAITLAACVYLKYVTFNYWSWKNVDYVKPAVPIGNMGPVFAGKRSFGEVIRDSYLDLKNSRIFGIFMFHQPVLVVADPNLIRVVLTKEFAHFHDRGIYCNEESDPLSGHLFSIAGSKWRFLRNKLSPVFTASKMKQMFFTIKEISETLTQRVAKDAENSELIEVKELMARFSTDVIASVAFDIKCNSLENKEAEFRTMGRKVFERRILVNVLAIICPYVLHLLKISVFGKEAPKFFIDVFEQAVKYRRDNKVVRNDFLDVVIQLMNKGYIANDNDETSPPLAASEASYPEADVENRKITMLEGAAQAFVFWIGGFDTSSSTVTFCLYELALHQVLQDKVAEEVNRVSKEFGELSYESIRAMDYLHKVVSETLRKYPVVPILNRLCNADFEFLGTGFRVEKKTPIIIPVLGLHWDPELYPEPENFDPERFDATNIARRHQYAYLPFGDGPRNCIGMRFGLLQTKVGLVSLLSKYRFTPGPGLQIPLVMDNASFVQVPVNGVKLRVEMRSS